ncbi:hypothetical protein NU219Hw_g202t1 [Hortaea werneckii]
MTGILSAGLAWAVPVRPDTLGAHLEAYAAGVPAITALRLCHRFGTGPAAHITRLPRELVLLIEDYVHAANWHLRSKPDCEWRSSFACFESQCEPRKHEGDWSGYAAIVNNYTRECDYCAKNTMNDDNCSYRCPDENNMLCRVCARGEGPQVCHRTCRRRWESEVNQLLRDDAAFVVQHEAGQRVWRDKIRQGPASPFAKYDRILSQHFGLEAYFASTKKGSERFIWPSHANYQWHELSDIRTTICYLTLPRVGAPEGWTRNSAVDGTKYRIVVEAANALPVDLTSIATPDAKMRRRFTFAMKTLALTPSVHPSQQHASPVSANRLKMRNDDGHKDAGSEDAEGKKSEPGPEYPQLTLLVNTRFHSHM